MTPLESIYEIESDLHDLQPYLYSKDVLVFKKARKKYESLVDRFFTENASFVKPEQRHECLRNYDYFLKLMAAARDRYYTDNGYSA